MTNIDHVIKNEIQDLAPINSWVNNNVCLIGDAAHATTPNMGQGACQAIEDAYVLTHFLNKNPIDIAFKNYEQLRMKKAKMIVKLSWRLGKISQINSPFISALRNIAMRLTPTLLNKHQSFKIYKLPEIRC